MREKLIQVWEKREMIMKMKRAKIRNNLKRRGKDIPTPAYKNYSGIFRDDVDR